jgi:tRNA 2-(methylsulfanyl)-N6-isopentenyladenosine37 hydroxylase
MLRLQSQTPPAWVNIALADFGAVLVDHAHCEHKAAVTAMSFVSKYPDDPELVLSLSALARDEAGHFHDVAALCFARSLPLGHPDKDAYVASLLGLAGKTPLESRVDRLLICALIEARSCERLQMLAEALPRQGHPLIDETVVVLYERLWREEATHHLLFCRLAERSLQRAGVADAPADMRKRLDALSASEASIMLSLPLRAAIH